MRSGRWNNATALLIRRLFDIPPNKGNTVAFLHAYSTINKDGITRSIYSEFSREDKWVVNILGFESIYLIADGSDITKRYP